MSNPMNTDLATLSPNWLGQYVAQILSTDFGQGSWEVSGDICVVETGADDKPISFLAAAPGGLVMGEWDGPTDIEVEFVPWREVRGIGFSGSDLEVRLSGDVSFTADMASLPSLADEEDDAVVYAMAETYTRQAAARLVTMLSDAEVKS